MIGGWQLATVLLALLFVIHSALLISVMRQVGNLMIMVNPTDPRSIGGGPEIDAEAAGYDGTVPAVLVFVAPNCAPCSDLAPTFSIFRDNWPEVVLVPVVSNADDSERYAYAAELDGGARADLPDLYREWGVPGTPFAIAVDASNRVRRSGITNTLDQLETLAAAALAPPAPEERELEEAMA